MAGRQKDAIGRRSPESQVPGRFGAAQAAGLIATGRFGAHANTAVGACRKTGMLGGRI